MDTKDGKKKKINSAYCWSITAKEKKKIPRSKPRLSLYHEAEGLI